MAFVNITDISVVFGNRDLIDRINLNISETSKISLAGANGSGKTTLLKVIAGIMAPAKGSVSMQKGTRISYLPQSGVVFSGYTLFDEADKAFIVFRKMIEKITELEKELALCKEGEGNLEALLEEHHALQEAVLSSGYYEREGEIESVLTGLGFSRADLGKMTESFSGGWQMRIALARVLLEKPDILLLDEPTNYLDIEAREWLEDFLNKFKSGYIIVSHDRFFLDVTCNEVIELFNGKLSKYKGNYSAYEKTRQQELEALVQRYERQQEEIEKTEDFIRRFRYNASKASLVQSRVKQLENLERIEIPESLKKMRFKFPTPPHSGKDVLIIEELNKFYGDFQALKNVNLYVTRGEKIALTGCNGAGKSTLLRILSQTDKNYTGNMRLGKDVSIGYFSQDFEATLNNEKSVIEVIESSSPTELIPSLRNLLGAFLFRGDDIQKKISFLSGGEKNRVALLKLLLHPSNLLILDEPTNHLDLNSKDILLEALKKYTGTLIFVSHDRYFIENLATRVIELTNGIAKDYPGEYEYYLFRKAKEAEESDAKANAGKAAAAAGWRSPAHSVSASSPKEGDFRQTEAASEREKEKAVKKEKRKLEKRLEEIMLLADDLEQKAKQIEEMMLKEEFYADGQKIKELKENLRENKNRQTELLAEWEKVEAAINSF
ncbi:MAG: ABC-F family ATP-binding cassette domain-containing protein [Spirochaetes bacterium]|nr:ABC-F family ATP-binding cassette domain-containing protein [Spirochaetota bacterium]